MNADSATGLSEEAFKATFSPPMKQLSEADAPPVDFWPYFETIPGSDFKGHDCSDGVVKIVYRDATEKFEHVLVESEDKNIFMVIVLDRENTRVHGHRLLDLNEEYGLDR